MAAGKCPDAVAVWGWALAGVGAGHGRREVRERLVFKELLAWWAGGFHAGSWGERRVWPEPVGRS